MEQDREGAFGVGRTANGPVGSPETFAIGELVTGQYFIVSRMSEGPTGTLYRAQDLKAAAEVTLKLLPGWSGTDQTLLARVRDELSVTQTLGRTQPAIAQVYGCDQTADGRTFVVLERLEGHTLAELIQRRETLPVERALDLTIKVARGLHAAHGIRLFHGAIGPEHVFVQSEDVVKVLGFEVARHQAPNVASAHPSATRRAVLTEAADLRAVAMLLLEMLTTGVRPGPNGAVPQPDAPRGGEVPPEVKQLVMRVLVTSPGQSDLDMDGLATALSAQRTRRREPPKPRASQRVRRSPHPRRWTLIGAVALAIVGIASVGLVTRSLVKMARSPATHEMSRGAAGPTAPNLASSSPDTTASPRSGDGGIERAPSEVERTPPGRPAAPTDDAVPSAPVKAPPKTESPVVDRPVRVAPTARVASPAPTASARQPETATPPSGGTVRTEPALPPARVTVAPEAESPVVERPPVAPPRPRETATRAPSGGSARTESDTLDPSAIIDWLLSTKGR